MSRAPRLRLSDPQIERYKKALGNVSRHHERIEEVFTTYFKDKNEKEIFEKIFGFAPRGEVSVEKGPAYVYVVIADRQDFAAAYKGDFTGIAGEEDMKKTERIAGFANAKTVQPKLKKCVAVSRAYAISDEMDRVKKHELRHALHGNIWGMEKWGRIEPKKERAQQTKEEESRDSFTHSMNMDAEVYLFCAKDEILAYMKGGDRMDEAKRKLLRDEEEGGLYDYFESKRADYENNIFAKQHREEFYRMFRQKRKEHEDVVTKCIGVVKNMELLGFSRDQIAGMLETEHPLRWGRVFETLHSASSFGEKKKNAHIKLREQYVRAVENVHLHRDVVSRVRSKKNRTKEDNAEHDRSWALMRVYESRALQLQDDIKRLAEL